MHPQEQEESPQFRPAKTQPQLSHQLEPKFIQEYYKGESKLTLGRVNLTYIKDNKFYNLLDKLSPRRQLRCGCVKSFCQAKYCQCYRAGQTCGQQCGCVGCRNRKSRKSASTNLEGPQTGCNCVKSGCLKKYCQCFQRGKKCGPHCHCSFCQNYQECESDRESES